MLRIDDAEKKLVRLERKTMRDFGFWERRDIQEMICRSPEAFCDELGERIFIIGTEIQPSEFVQDRVDLLAVDPDGGAVVIELKRDSHKLQLLQALTYSAMIAKWEPKSFCESLARFNTKFRQKTQSVEEAQEELSESLDEGDVSAVNRTQRIILLAEEFDYEVLVTAEWLTERNDLDIRCYRLALAKNGSDKLLTCTRAYPPPELTDIAVRRRRNRELGGPIAQGWQQLQASDSAAMKAFFEGELASGLESDEAHRMLRYKRGGRVILRVYAKRKFATVIQRFRFQNDEAFWKQRLDPGAEVRPRNHGKNLRFNLKTLGDFEAFREAWTKDLKTQEFTLAVDDDVDSGADDDETVEEAAAAP